jgi:hypothetical protein
MQVYKILKGNFCSFTHFVLSQLLVDTGDVVRKCQESGTEEHEIGIVDGKAFREP